MCRKMIFRRAKTRRFVLGILLLLIVDLIWVVSAGLTEVNLVAVTYADGHK